MGMVVSEVAAESHSLPDVLFVTSQLLVAFKEGLCHLYMNYLCTAKAPALVIVSMFVGMVLL